MIFNIVGGTYYELCRDPHWEELYGSGLRAVHALSDKALNIEFHTYIGIDDIESLLAITDSLKVKLNYSILPVTTTFSYDYPLSEPSILKNESCIFNTDVIKAEIVLQYGMIEGNRIVDAKTVVYDPQSPTGPSSFWKNGSNTERLLWVCNLQEAEAFTKENNIEKISQFLFSKENIDAAIIKMGSNGAVLIQKDKAIVEIPLYQTKRVWPIGTGDVFSAMFAYYHLAENKSLEDSAIQASLSTAYYTETTILPIPTSLKKDRYKCFYNNFDKTKTIYLAGPFFNMGQRWLIEEIRNQLQAFGLKVFSPYHDIGFGIAKVVAPLDIQAIENCHLMFAILDGLDSGTFFEIGYAKALNIPVIVLNESEQGEALTMIVGTNCLIETDLSTAIYKTVWYLNEKA